jgi:hypothetical protein
MMNRTPSGASTLNPAPAAGQGDDEVAQMHVSVAEQEVALRVAHGRRPVTAPAGLVEHEVAVDRPQPREQRRGVGREINPRGRRVDRSR